MDTLSKHALRADPFNPIGKTKFGLAVVSLVSTLLFAGSSAAELVRVEAVGEIDFVNAALGNAFSLGQEGRMILTYDTDAVDTNGSANIGTFSKGAIKTFQIFDKNYNPYFSFENGAGGTITLTDGGGANDSIALESYSAARLNENPDDGLRGPSRNSLKLLGGFFGALASTENVFDDDSLPPASEDIALDWPGNTFYFALQYCSGCGDGNGFGRGVNFKISKAIAFKLKDTLLTLKPNGTELLANGVLDATALETFANAQKKDPSAKTIVLEHVPGSADDEANVVLGVKIRKAGFNTRVPSNGFIASGGVDMFLAGNERLLESGACIGIHSWSDADGVEGKDIPKNDPRHAFYLKYYRDIGISEAFYWHTLKVAPADGMHYMSHTEVNDFALTTTAATALGTQSECENR